MGSLLQDKLSRRTFQLLSRVVESRVSLQWILPLLEYRRDNAPSSCQDNGLGDVVDGVSSLTRLLLTVSWRGVIVA